MPRQGNKLAYVVAAFTGLAGPAWAGEVSTAYEDEWLSLSGTVEAVLATGFVLDYRDNDITVELDKFNWDVEKSVLQGKHVTITGRMDRHLYDDRSIEAAIVYVPTMNEFLYADPRDEEGDPSLIRTFAPGLFASMDDGDWLSFSGRVTEIEGDEILVDSGMSILRVDTSPAPGALASPSVDIGDHVLVIGRMDAADLFDKREVEADSITKLTNLGS